MHTSFNIFKHNVKNVHKIISRSQYLIAYGGYPDLVGERPTGTASLTVLNLEICASVVWMLCFVVLTGTAMTCYSSEDL